MKNMQVRNPKLRRVIRELSMISCPRLSTFRYAVIFLSAFGVLAPSHLCAHPKATPPPISPKQRGDTLEKAIFQGTPINPKEYIGQKVAFVGVRWPTKSKKHELGVFTGNYRTGTDGIVWLIRPSMREVTKIAHYPAFVVAIEGTGIVRAVDVAAKTVTIEPDSIRMTLAT